MDILTFFQIKIININKKKSLILLNEYALKLDFNVPLLSLQKLINKNDVKPISSQPKKSVKRLFAKSKKTILKINQFSNKKKLSSLASYLK